MADDVTPPSRFWHPAIARALGYAVSAVVVIVLTTQVRWGENLDGRAASSMGSHARWWMRHIDGVTVPVMLALGVVAMTGAVIHFRRGRKDLALRAVILVAGTQLTVEVAKHLIQREDGVSNTTPSGHSSLALSLALAVVVVWPQRFTQTGALVAAAFVAYGTIIGGWHTPGDVMAACAITGMWASLVMPERTLTGKKMSIFGGMAVAGTGVHPAQVHWVLAILTALGVWGSIMMALPRRFRQGGER